MTDNLAHATQWRAGRPCVVGTTTLVPIERIDRIRHVETARRFAPGRRGAGSDRSRGAASGTGGGTFGGIWLTWTPWAVVIRDATGLRALDLAGATLPLAQVRERVPDLDRVLASA